MQRSSRRGRETRDLSPLRIWHRISRTFQRGRTGFQSTYKTGPDSINGIVRTFMTSCRSANSTWLPLSSTPCASMAALLRTMSRCVMARATCSRCSTLETILGGITERMTRQTPISMTTVLFTTRGLRCWAFAFASSRSRTPATLVDWFASGYRHRVDLSKMLCVPARGS